MENNIIESNLLLRRQCEDEVFNRLQMEQICGNLALDEVSTEEFNRKVENLMKQKQYINNLKKKGLTEIALSDGRFGWRPWGKQGLFVRATSIEALHEKTFREYERLQRVQSMTLQQALDIFIQFNSDVSENTHDKWQKDFNKFAKNLLDTPLNKLSPLSILTEYKQVVAKEHPCSTTCSNYRGELKRTLEHVCDYYDQILLFDIEKLNKDLIKNTKKDYLLKSNEVMLLEENKDCYSQEEATSMINLARSYDNIRSYAGIATLLTGCRISEVCSLKKCNVNLEEGIIEIVEATKYKRKQKIHEIGEPKKQKHRKIVLSDLGVEIFKRVFELAPESEYVFPDYSNKKKTEYLATYKVSDEIDLMCKELGMIVKSNHDQRRTYDTMLSMACIPDALRKKLMGHTMSKREIDSHYVRIQYTLPELRNALNSAFDNYYKF